MTRLLTLIMILVLVVAHGSAVAAAICHHDSSAQHVAALKSHDAGIAAVAADEEDAAKMASKKGSLGSSASWPSGMLPGPALRAPFRVAEKVERHPADPPILAGSSVLPLLEPPAA